MTVSKDIIRSKERVEKYGEVFTPPSVVEVMLNLVADEAARPESRFLEPACGTGNFLVPVLQRKLKAVTDRGGDRLDGLAALATLYGIELLADNVAECRKRLLKEFAEWLRATPGEPSEDRCSEIAKEVVGLNIIHGDFINAVCLERQGPVEFYQWERVGSELRKTGKAALKPRIVTGK